MLEGVVLYLIKVSMFWRIPAQDDVFCLHIYNLQVFRRLRFSFMIKNERQGKQEVIISVKLLNKKFRVSKGKGTESYKLS